MISSEVQRTLVKSPPELWTELSDHEALARHLGALGEIKITRTEPEKLIEWESEGTTGTVAIKPSGWGTKVTLTVNRELPKAAEPESDDARGESLPATSPGEPVEIDGAGRADEVPASVAHAETDRDDEPSPHAQEEIPDAELPAPMLDVKPGPATEAARRAAGWPTSTAAPAIESELRAAEAEASEPYEPAPLPEWPATVADDAGASEPELEPRRGFFARLFGRRRRAPLAPASPPEPLFEDAAADEPEPLATEVLDPQPLPVTVVAEEVTERAGVEDAPVAETAAGEGAPVVGAPGVEAEAAPVGEELTEEPEGFAEPLLAPAEPLPAPTGPGEPAAPAAEASVAGPADAADAAAAPASDAGLAAELKAAEEVAADEVTAVLTGVLDRLGAAHHRPFSRS